MKRYYVCGAGRRYDRHGWFSGVRPGPFEGFRTFIVAKTYQHALRQFYRLPVRHRQIDVRGDGPARCIVYGKGTKQ